MRPYRVSTAWDVPHIDALGLASENGITPSGRDKRSFVEGRFDILGVVTNRFSIFTASSLQNV
jgi:hypothetical protein